MKFFAAVLALTTLLPAALATDVRYDTTYDAKDGSLATVACSDGANGLLTKGFTTFGSLPSFPNIGAAQAVAGWNSTACGTCWQLAYKGESIFVTAVDHAGDGFNIALAALNTLTNGTAVQVGIISATATQVAASKCGL
ncbi:hypothetical protein FA95DRAFT_1493267 [Auriscalpium vulgare]|uniref:Uncharacterized protein n=1 Tax=Auriscalpium vulgare TaxID=40419 RepID=A0ACB8RTQ8_9AGAM|nr:hypothetical protein FA95DRAFT_1493267 [Auriscalpium vulgare]